MDDIFSFINYIRTLFSTLSETETFILDLAFKNETTDILTVKVIIGIIDEIESMTKEEQLGKSLELINKLKNYFKCLPEVDIIVIDLLIEKKIIPSVRVLIMVLDEIENEVKLLRRSN